MKLDLWQEAVLKAKGSLVLRSGRQVGKSFIIGIKAAAYALENPNKLVMVISKTDKQAHLLFSKILYNINLKNRGDIKKGKDRPTKHVINLKNGSVIHSLPVGDTGFGIMGYTIDLLIADEAAFIPEEVWNSIIPALAITRGEIWLLSTPFLKQGYYYNCFQNKNFTSFHTTSEECPRKDQEFLDEQKATLTKSQYAQMYLGQFVDDLHRYFSDALIHRQMIGSGSIHGAGEFFLGVDFAGYGGDQNAFVVVKKTRDHMEVVEIVTTTFDEIKDNMTVNTIQRIKNLEQKYNFRQIYVDDAGLGSPILDMLKTEDGIKRKIKGINNARKSIEHGTTKMRKILKNDLYANTLSLLEHNLLILMQSDVLKSSLRSILFDYTDDKREKIYGANSGKDTHICEALNRAVWGAKDKHLKLWFECN